MHCWKAINLSRHYGEQRMFILSLLTMLFTFILLYIPITYIFLPANLYDNHFFLFLTALFLIYPTHKLLHYIPIAHLGSKVKKDIQFKFLVIPLIQVRVNEPVQRATFLIALLTPFVVLTVLLLGACFILPHYVHYFTILLAFHVGLCVSDFICAKNIIKAPSKCFIEENDDGFEILVFEP